MVFGLLAVLFLEQSQAQSKVVFPSLDGEFISADWYLIDDRRDLIILCHQARYSRGEYVNTALRLNALGFNCLALDMRSGNISNGIVNETAQRVKGKGKPSGFLDAEQDIRAAINYARKQDFGRIILLGSSYSSGLVLKLAAELPEICAVLAFSPGEYYGKDFSLKGAIKTLDKPAFITSSKIENTALKILLSDTNSEKIILFSPQGPGDHGSRALWRSGNSSDEYWLALSTFLLKLKAD